jgi:hypothetical protein
MSASGLTSALRLMLFTAADRERKSPPRLFAEGILSKTRRRADSRVSHGWTALAPASDDLAEIQRRVYYGDQGEGAGAKPQRSKQ